jgi:exonuclease III
MAYLVNLYIFNDLDDTLHYDYQSIHGHDLKPGDINPHSFRSLSVDQTWGAWVGTEGRLVVKNKKTEEQVMVFSVCDSYSDDGNYFHLEQVSPFIDYDLRFGNGSPTGDKNWGSTVVPTGGTPLGAQIRIAKKNFPASFSVLTYNTHLFWRSIAEWIEVFTGRKLIVYDYERIGKLVEKLFDPTPDGRPDVILLQEVWANDVQKELAATLAANYPYSYVVPDESTIKATAGLLIVSRYPILNPYSEKYSEVSGDDSHAQKSYAVFSINVPLAMGKLVPVVIGTTHAPCNIKEAEDAIALAAKKTFDDKKVDRLLAGDFNLHLSNADENKKLQQIMTDYGAQDLTSKCWPEIKDSYTIWPAGNTLSKALGDGPSPKERIDYVFFANGVDSHLKPTDVKVFHDWTVKCHNQDIDVSDHYPTRVNFQVGL